MLDQREPHWVFFNIGDSRTYLYDGSLRQITIDHSLVQEMVDSGLLAAEDAEGHPESNVITRAVGFDESPIPDLWMMPVRAGQRILVCSDGLTKEIRDSDIARILAEGGTARDTVRALVAAALDHHGRDNVTAVVIDVIEDAQRES
jgi:protein phosphatase